MKLDSDDFELFGVPRRFEQEAAALDARWRTLLSEAHPDRFVSEGAQAQRLAMQWSVRINEAHRRLKDPVRRAAYLCELQGAPINAEDNTAMPAVFLMQQMEWRESLDEASGLADVEALASAVAAHRERALTELRVLIDDRKDHAAAAQQVRALMFVERFARDVDARLEALEQ
ncbi:MAG: Fe-S protein assembly co-chaperone HscB [Burkholderiaceae bacterium]|nr:Fe-S protein assembly co-chaperone HscB [Burkholderiaceae bacterium]